MKTAEFPKFLRLLTGAMLSLGIASRVTLGANIEYAGNPGALSFADGANWIGGIAPGQDDSANINLGDGLTDFPYIDGTVLLQRFQIAQLTGDSGGLELRSGANLTTLLSSNHFVGARGPGHLRIQEGATMSLSGALQVGWGTALNDGVDGTGNGTVTQTGGSYFGSTSSAGIVLGSIGPFGSFSTSTGTYNMQAGTINLGGSMDVGPAGIGTFNLVAGDVTLNSFLQIGRANTGNGSVIQSGGSMTVNRTSADYGVVLNHGTIANGTALYQISGGSLSVRDTNAGVRNGGTGSVASSTIRVIGDDATINIANDYLQNANASLELQIDTGISPLQLGRDAKLNGTLDVSFSVVPAVNDQFTIITYGRDLIGTFAAFDILVDSPAGPNTVQLSIDYGPGSGGGSVLLKVESLQLLVPGDFDGDGDVDGADFVAWQTNFPTASGSTLAMGDADGDGDVDGADFVVWQTNFPFTPGPGVTPVPEPCGFVIAVLGGMLALAGRRKLVRCGGE